MTDLGVSGGYVLKAQTIRVECDLLDKGSKEPAYPGLWAEVRKNLTIGERRDLQDAAAAIDRRADEAHAAALATSKELDAALGALAEGDADERARLMTERTTMLRAYAATTDQIIIDRFTLIAPHVHRWNLYTVDAGGEFVPIPPPREAGAAVLDEIDIDLVTWLTRTTLTAYRLGFIPGSQTSGAPPEPTPAPNGSKPKESTRRSQTSPKKSSSVAPSAFEA